MQHREQKMAEEKLDQQLVKKINNLKRENRNFEILKSEEDAPILISYFSKHGNLDVRLNGKANNKTSENNGKAFCGDLATSFLDFQKSKDTKHLYHDAHRTKENLEKLSLIADSKYYITPPEKRAFPIAVFPLSCIGDQLHEFAETLKKEDYKLLFFESVNHTMAIVIQQKSNGSYVIKFYDPNFTNIHLRTLCENLDAVKDIRIEHLLKNKYIDLYFPDYKSAVFFLPGPELRFNQDLYTPSVTSKFMETNGVVADQLDLLSKFFRHGIERTEEKNISDIITSILNMEEVDEAKKLEMLSVKVTSTGKAALINIPGLYLLLQDGHTNAVHAYVKSVLASKLTDKNKLILLTANNHHGAPGLFVALQSGHADAIQTYIQAILDSTLINKDKLALLAANNHLGTPGLFAALESGHADAIRAYIQTILNSTLINKDKLTLLTTSNSVGTPGLFEALLLGNADAVQAYIESVLASNLPEKDKLTLLAAKRSDGTPGLLVALRNGHTTAVRAYVKGVLASNIINENKLALLAAKKSDGTSGLCIAALQNERADIATQAYLEEVFSSELNPEEKMKALIPASWPSINYYKVKNYVKKILSNFDAKQVSKLPNSESLIYVAKEIGDNKFLKLARRKLAKEQLQNSINYVETYALITEKEQLACTTIASDLRNLKIDENNFEPQIKKMLYQLEKHIPEEKISEVVDLLRLRGTLEKYLGCKLLSQKLILNASKEVNLKSSIIGTPFNFFGQKATNFEIPFHGQQISLVDIDPVS